MQDITLARLALAYGTDESAMAQAVYTLAEQLHQHYCLSRGIVNHNESRPDQHVALNILGSMAGVDWWLVREADRLPRGLDGPFYGAGDGTSQIEVGQIDPTEG